MIQCRFIDLKCNKIMFEKEYIKYYHCIFYCIDIPGFENVNQR